MIPSSSSSSATVRVDKATSDLLIGPDWTMNMDICDSINSNHWEAKEVVKAVKKRLQHKNPRVQLLALTLLETMVKNCGDYVHSQIAERNILQEMIKIVKKKTDMHVRDKILVLLDSWQEALGGPGGKFPQYYWAYEDLRRFGVVFPQRSLDAAPIFTPPVTHSTLRHAQPSYGMPINSTTRLDEAMAAEIENLSLSTINSMRIVLDLFADMLQAVNPSDRASVKDEVIVDLVNQCRSNQKKLMQMLTTTGDEELLGQGLELNDSLQYVLAKHDAISSGSPLPTQVTNFNPRSSAPSNDSGPKSTDVKEFSQTTNVIPSAPFAASIKGQIEEEEEEDEEDDFAQLARRHSKMQSTSQDTSTGTSQSLTPVNASNNSVSSISATSSALVPTNALALPNPPAPVRTTKEQDMIDLLSLALTTTATVSPQSPHTPLASSQDINQASVSPTAQGYPYASQPYPQNPVQVPFNNSSYVVPWAQPQPQPQPQPQARPQTQLQPQSQPLQPQNQPQYPQNSFDYPPPPWAPTPGYLSNQNQMSTPYTFSTPRARTPASYTSSMQGTRPLQSFNSFPARGSNGGSAMNGGEPSVGSSPRTTTPAAPGQKPFVPSYRLFEDLNVLGNGDGRFKMKSSTSSSLSGNPGPSMVGGRK